jgi:hypothetical protein
MSLALGTDQIDNLTFGVSVTPNGAAPALSTGKVTFTDATGDGPLVSAGSTNNQVAVLYSGVSPLLTGTIALGTAGFTLPAGAGGGQSYSVTIANVSGSNDTVSPTTVPSITIGAPSTVTVSGGSLTAQTITFGALANKTLGTAPFTISATASSGLTVSFASNTPAVCTVSGNTVTLVAAGTCSITASQAGNATYAAASPVTQTFSVSGSSLTAQTITFGALANKTLGTAPFTISATATSGLAVSFTSNTALVCTVAGNTVTLAATGTCSITASQAGNATYAAASPVTQTFTVLPGSMTPVSITCGSTACPATFTLLPGFTTGAYSQDLTATGGVAPYKWTLPTGYILPPGLALVQAATGTWLLTGTPTQAGTFNFNLNAADAVGNSASQTFSIVVLNVSASALARVGVLSQFAPGASWDTTIYVVNNSASAVPVRLVIHADNGTTVLPVTTALTVTQQGDVQTGITTTTLDRVLNPNTTLVVDAGLGQSTLAQGWVDVLSTAAVNGFAVFRYAPNGLAPTASGYFTPYEGTVPLQTQLSVGTITLPFDNTTPSYSASGQFTTGIAIGSLTGGTVTATFYDNNGNQLGSQQTFTLGALAHTAFMVNAGPTGQNWSFTNGYQGVVKFTGPSLIGLGLRASPYGTLTTVPAILQ